MSTSRKEMFNCPKCGKPVEFTLWDSVDTTKESAAEDIISGELFDALCPECGQKTRMVYPIIFNDIARNMVVHYVAGDELGDALQASEVTMSHGGRVRIVTSQEALREKICILEAGLDDRIVELLKIFVIRQALDQLKDKEVTDVYFLPDEKQPRMEMNIDGQAAYISVVMDGYRYLEEKYGPALSAPEKEAIIDRNWAHDFLTYHNGL